MAEFTQDDVAKAMEQLAKMPPRPWTNPWEENEEAEAEAIRDAEGKFVIGLRYYDGYHLEVGIEVCQILLAIINTLYPAALAALAKALRENEDWREIARIIENLCYGSSGACVECGFAQGNHEEGCGVGRLDYAVQTYGRAAEEKCD